MMLPALDISVDTSDMDRAIERALRDTADELPEVTRKATLFFAQSAAKSTPPDQGRARFKKKTKERPIRKLRDEGRRRTRYAVPYRTARKRGVKYFDSRSLARDFSRVMWRGIGRAGWYGAIPAFGGSIASQPGSEKMKANPTRWGRGSMRRERLYPVATLHNYAPTVRASYVNDIAQRSLTKASRRYIAAINAELKKTAEKFNR